MKFDFYQKLTGSKVFKDWQKKHPSAYLSHFYCQLGNDLQLKNNWEIGFYEPDKDKIVIFIVGKEITLKPEEEVFKKEGLVEELDLEKVEASLELALSSFKKIKEEEYPSENLLGGFIILQNFQGKNMWNISFATQSLQILNFKLDAISQETISHQLISFIEKSAA